MRSNIPLPSPHPRCRRSRSRHCHYYYFFFASRRNVMLSAEDKEEAVVAGWLDGLLLRAVEFK